MVNCFGGNLPWSCSNNNEGDQPNFDPAEVFANLTRNCKYVWERLTEEIVFFIVRYVCYIGKLYAFYN